MAKNKITETRTGFARFPGTINDEKKRNDCSVKLFILFTVFFCSVSFGQPDSLKARRIGFIGIFDYSYNFSDRVLNPGLGRKWMAGLRFTNKRKQFIGIAAVGIKVFKFNIYSPSFRPAFLNDVKQNYVPVNGANEDSIIGADIGALNAKGFGGTVSFCGQLGFILNKKLRPSFSICIGNESFILYDRALASYEDPQHGDIDYVSMPTIFYELRFGLTPFFKESKERSFCMNFNIGYKIVDYGAMRFGSTPLSAYTTGSLANKYKISGKLTLSVSVMIW